jgi:hypothetical protein
MNQQLLRQSTRGGSRGGKSQVGRAGEAVACPVVTSPLELGSPKAGRKECGPS